MMESAMQYRLEMYWRANGDLAHRFRNLESPEYAKLLVDEKDVLWDDATLTGENDRFRVVILPDFAAEEETPTRGKLEYQIHGYDIVITPYTPNDTSLKPGWNWDGVNPTTGAHSGGFAHALSDLLADIETVTRNGGR